MSRSSWKRTAILEEKWKKGLYLKKEYDTLNLKMKRTVRCVDIERGCGKEEEL
mgnify:CR=1 FL=1